MRVMQLFPQGHDQTDEPVADGIRHQHFVETNTVMRARDCSGKGYTDKSPGIPHTFAGGWQGCSGKNCPEAHDLKANNGPLSQSSFHCHLRTSNNTRARLFYFFNSRYGPKSSHMRVICVASSTFSTGMFGSLVEKICIFT
jgi:hypothetical protein